MFVGYDKDGSEIARVPVAGQKAAMEKVHGRIAFWREDNPAPASVTETERPRGRKQGGSDVQGQD